MHCAGMLTKGLEIVFAQCEHARRGTTGPATLCATQRNAQGQGRVDSGSVRLVQEGKNVPSVERAHHLHVAKDQLTAQADEELQRTTRGFWLFSLGTVATHTNI